MISLRGTHLMVTRCTLSIVTRRTHLDGDPLHPLDGDLLHPLD